MWIFLRLLGQMLGLMLGWFYMVPYSHESGCSTPCVQLPEPIAYPAEDGRNMRNCKRIGIYYPSSSTPKFRLEKRIRKCNKIWLGNFKTVEEAMIVYDIARKCVGQETIHYKFHPNYFNPFHYKSEMYRERKDIEKFLEDAATDSDKDKAFKAFVKKEVAKVMGMESIKNFLHKKVEYYEVSTSEGTVPPQLDTLRRQSDRIQPLDSVALGGAVSMTSTDTSLDDASSMDSSSSNQPQSVVTILSELPVHTKALRPMPAIAGGANHYVPGGDLLSFRGWEAMPTSRAVTGIFGTDAFFNGELSSMEGLLRKDATETDSTDSSYVEHGSRISFPIPTAVPVNDSYSWISQLESFFDL